MLTVRCPVTARTAGGCSVGSKSRRDEKGFIITLELIVLMTVFGVVFLFALSILQQWIVNQLGDYFGAKILVFDSSTTGGASTPKFVGKAVGFDHYGAPMIIFRDTSLSPPLAAVLGVRSPDVDPTIPSPSPSYGYGGFTSRMRVYYQADNCTGAPNLLNVYSGDWGAQRFTPDINGYNEPVQDVYPLQGMAYAIGLNQILYRSQNPVALGAPAFGSTKRINSYFDSTAYPQGVCYNLGVAQNFVAYPVTGCEPGRLASAGFCYPTLKRMVLALPVVTMTGPGGLFARPMWIPAGINNIPATPTVGGANTFAPATNGEASTPPPTPVRPGYQAPCPEGTPGCPKLP